MHLNCFIHVIFIQWLRRGVSSLGAYDDNDSDGEDYLSHVTRFIPRKGPLIIDTDVGVDDATAIILLLKYKLYDVKAITCVRGNTDVFNVAINVQKVLNAANRQDIPVYVGADFGLIHTEVIHSLYGKDGFADLYDNGIKMTSLGKGHAAIAMAKLVTENPGMVNVICLGPLTNLALACHIQPQFLRLAKSVFVTGGTFGVCTVSPQAEFNFYMDPEAAQSVFQHAEVLNCPIVVLPMDIAKDLSFDKHIRKSVLGKMTSVGMNFLNRVYDKLDMMYANENKYSPEDKMISGDFYVSAIAINRAAVRSMKTYHVDVETHGNSSRGLLIIDFANVTHKAPNAHVIYSANTLSLDKTIIFYLHI